MRRALLLAIPFLTLPGIAAATSPIADVALITGTPAQIEALLREHPSAIAVGVMPDTDDSFGAALHRTAPEARPDPVDLEDRLALGCIQVVREQTTFEPPLGMAASCTKAAGIIVFDDVDIERSPYPLRPATPRTRGSIPPEDAADLTILVAHSQTCTDAGCDAVRDGVLVGIFGRAGLLRADDTKRAGVVTPFDLAATILQRFGLPRSDVPGVPVRVEGTSRSQERLAALRARLSRDLGADAAPSKTTASFGIFAGLFGALLALYGRRVPARRLAQGACLVPLGYVAGMFVQSGSGTLRSLPVGIAFAIGAAWPARDSKRACSAALLFTFIVLAVLTITAAIRPDGEPALSFWGNPLSSWRFYGLRNHLVAFIAGSVVSGVFLLGLRRRWMIVIGFAALLLIGTPHLGANYIGVFTTSFAILLTVLLLTGERPSLAPVAISGVIAAGLTLLALWSDTSSVSHGGRALTTVRSGGIGALWRIVRERALLDYHEVADIGWAAFIAFGLLVVAAIYFFRWAWRARDAAVAALAAAAFLALFVEDSGFFTGGILMLYPAIGFTLARAGGADTTTVPAPG